MKKLKEFMEQKSISAEELSPIIAVSARQIYRWIAGQAEITASNLIALADYFSCTTDELLGHEVTEPAPIIGIKITPLSRRLLEAFDKLSDEDQRKFVGMAEALAVLS